MKYFIGDSYSGLWEYDSLNGKGIYTWKNGDIFEGYFKDNKFHGKGIYKRNDKVNFEGNFIYDCANGEFEISY